MQPSSVGDANMIDYTSEGSTTGIQGMEQPSNPTEANRQLWPVYSRSGSFSSVCSQCWPRDYSKSDWVPVLDPEVFSLEPS